MLHRDLVEVGVEPSHEAVRGFQQHHSGLDGRAADASLPQVPEENNDLGGQLYPCRSPADDGDREVAGTSLPAATRADRRLPGIPQGEAQPERVLERREELEVRGDALLRPGWGAPARQHQVLVADLA